MNKWSVWLLTLFVTLMLLATGCVAVPAPAPEQPAAAPSQAEPAPAGGEAAAEAAGEIRIGINAEITGDIPSVGENCKNAAEMYAEEVNAAGGLEVGGQKYRLTLMIEDDEAKAESAAAANTKLITQDGVLAIVGPNASKQAVPAGEVANASKTPMISPWSTNPATTRDRPWVFRAPFLDDFQGPVVANFVTEEYGLTKAAVLYDVASDYSKGLAEFFKQAWEEKNGPGSVLAYESFTTGDADFSAQLTKIRSSGTEFLFTPQYYNEVPLIIQQAKELGVDFPIVGSDSWSDPQMLELCGADCEGYFFVAHYIPAGAVGATKEFIDKYTAKYGYVPSDVGALTWDSMAIITQAIQDCGAITGNLAQDRQCVRDAMAKIRDYEGVTGKMTFTEEGDPIKCAAIAQIKEGEFQFYKQVCP